MTNIGELYYCEICGNVTEVVHAGAPALVCCGQPMEKLVAQTADSAYEKHVPVMTKTENGVCVKVGSVPHPMTDAHYIAFIEVCTEDQVLRADLDPGQEPEAEFKVCFDKVVAVRSYCNLHGLWAHE